MNTPPQPNTQKAGRTAAQLTAVVAVGVLVQAVLAGVFLGADHPKAVDVHEALGPLLIVPALVSTVISGRWLRTTPAGRRASAAGLGLTVALIAETALGLLADRHAGVLILHIPLAVAIFGMLTLQLHSLRSAAEVAALD
jgi:hypothetical protein